MKTYLRYLTLLLASSLVFAQDEPPAAAGDQAVKEGEFSEAPMPPTLPPQTQSGEALEPEVSIRTTEKETIEEYRIGGKLYMVKIIPDAGPAYYLIDSNGDGELDVREDEITKSAVPQWVLFSW